MKMLLSLLVLVSAALLAPAPPARAASDALIGTWQGTLNTGGPQLRLVIHIEQSAAGAFSATMDSPDQGAFGIPVSQVTFADNKLTLRVDAVPGGGLYEGTLAGTKLTGTWKQGGVAMALNLDRISADPKAQVGQVTMPADVERWEGTLNAGGQTLGVVFHVGKQADGTYVATMDVPAQGLANAPASSVTYTAAQLRLTFDSLAATFEGKVLEGGKEIQGTWSQAGQGVPLTLTRK